MKRLHWLGWSTFLVVVVLLGFRDTASANTESVGHELEAEVHGYHIALTSQNAWAKGDNSIHLALTDSMGLPVNNAEVELLIQPSLDTHGESEASPHGSEGPAETTAAMDMGSSAAHGSAVHAAPPNVSEAPSHGAPSPAPAVPMAFQGEGTYIGQAHLDSTGRQDIRAMVHVDGEMLQADFAVGGATSSPRSIVLWTFAGINAAILFSAGLRRKVRLNTVRSLA